MIVNELRQWSVWSCRSDAYSTPGEALQAAKSALDAGNAVYRSDKQRQIHDLLRECGVISGQSLENGYAEDCAWVGENDWVYRAEFDAPAGGGPHFLSCRGLDTVCDLFLNGRHIGSSRSMYLPFRADITEYLDAGARNELLIYFHQHVKMIRHYERIMPDEWRAGKYPPEERQWNAAPKRRGRVPAGAMLRRMQDYGQRPNDNLGFKPIGIFDAVTVESVEHAELLNTDIEVTLNDALDMADVAVTITCRSYGGARLSVGVSVTDPDGKQVASAELAVASVVTAASGTPDADANTAANGVSVADAATAGDAIWNVTATLRIENPRLWWPKNYGEHPLYRLNALLKADDADTACGVPVAEVTRPFGVRRLRKHGNMIFEYNGVPVRLWGADIAPVWGPSNTFNRGYAFELIDRIDMCGINTVRVWGPSQPYPDEFYDRLDELGITVWQDFPTGGSQLPYSEEYNELLRDEAAHMVRRLKHHPCIYLWCGGNENIYMSELYGETDWRGFDMLTSGFRDICAKLDPQRYYHVSSPYEGRYTNDPLIGDSHGSRAFRAFCPGELYGAFFSENIRVFPPQYKSFRRWRGDDIWEDGYVDHKPFGCLKPMPSAWQKLVGNNGEEKFGPIWDYYAATNVRELIYKYTAAAGQDIYQLFARSRRGNPAHKSHEEQFCRGQILWKLNDPWPGFYCSLVDYYLEPSLPYYSTKRAVQPVFIDFEVADHIYLWGVNDTREAVSGTLELTLYNLEHETVVRTDRLPAALQPGTSRILMNLDPYGYMHWFTLLHARLLDGRGNVLSVTNQFLTKENMLPFHDAKLELVPDGDAVLVSTDKFARCVELSAGEDGNAFGWVFEDNFFDLFPFEKRRVRIQKRGDGGCVRAQAQYSPHVASISV